jgi:hypothetical protein
MTGEIVTVYRFLDQVIVVLFQLHVLCFQRQYRGWRIKLNEVIFSKQGEILFLILENPDDSQIF